METVVKYDL